MTETDRSVKLSKFLMTRLVEVKAFAYLSTFHEKNKCQCQLGKVRFLGVIASKFKVAEIKSFI